MFYISLIYDCKFAIKYLRGIISANLTDMFAMQTYKELNQHILF